MQNRVIVLLMLSIYINFNLIYAAAIDGKRQLSEVVRTFVNDGSKVRGISDDKFATYNLRKIHPIRIWDIKTGKCIGQLDGHKGIVTDVILLDENTLVSVDESGLIKVWDLTSFKEKRSLQSQLTDNLKFLKLEGNKFILDDIYEKEIWDLSLDDEHAMIHSFYAFKIMPLNNKKVAIFNNDRSLCIFNIEKKESEKLTQNWGDHSHITSIICLTNNVMILSLTPWEESQPYLNVIDIGSENIVKQRIKQNEHDTALLKIDDHNILVGYENGEIKKLSFIDYETPPRETLIFQPDDNKRIIKFVDKKIMTFVGIGINRIAALSSDITIRTFNLDFLGEESLEETLNCYTNIIRLCDGRFIVYNTKVIEVENLDWGGI